MSADMAAIGRSALVADEVFVEGSYGLVALVDATSAHPQNGTIRRSSAEPMDAAVGVPHRGWAARTRTTGRLRPRPGSRRNQILRVPRERN